jgi:hypothetical protein
MHNEIVQAVSAPMLGQALLQESANSYAHRQSIVSRNPQTKRKSRLSAARAATSDRTQGVDRPTPNLCISADPKNDVL